MLHGYAQQRAAPSRRGLRVAWSRLKFQVFFASKSGGSNARWVTIVFHLCLFRLSGESNAWRPTIVFHLCSFRLSGESNARRLAIVFRLRSLRLAKETPDGVELRLRYNGIVGANMQRRRAEFRSAWLKEQHEKFKEPGGNNMPVSVRATRSVLLRPGGCCLWASSIHHPRDAASAFHRFRPPRTGSHSRRPSPRRSTFRGSTSPSPASPTSAKEEGRVAGHQQGAQSHPDSFGRRGVIQFQLFQLPHATLQHLDCLVRELGI